MSTIELKEELQRYIEIGDDNFIQMLYDKVQSYVEQKKMDRMIAEAEEDIKAGRTYSLEVAKKMIL